MRPLIQLEAESRIRLRSSWRGSGGRFEQANGRRSAGPKERRRNSRAVQRELSADDLSATFRMMPPEFADLLSLDTRGNLHLE